MAGAGYKLFNTGDVLTAAQVNTYLMEQTVMVFANAAARTTALSGVVSEGMISYLKDTNAVEVYDGSNWVSSDDPNAIQNTIVDAKGDLIAASAADTPARLAVGNNGETLVADSSATTGLRWTAGNPIGNPVLNSNFSIWQRGTANVTTALVYTADRWQKGGGTHFGVSRQATGDTTNLPFIQYAARVQRTNGSTTTGGMDFFQCFETANSIPYAGRTVTLSFYARKGANYSATSDLLSANIYTGTGTDQNLVAGSYTGQTQPLSFNATLTSSWQRFSGTATLSASMTEMTIYIIGIPTGTAGANDWYEITGVQIDVGSVALPYRPYAATLAGELAAAMRYYQKSYDVATTPATVTNSGGITQPSGNVTNTSVVAHVHLPVKMRGTPTVTIYSRVSGNVGVVDLLTGADAAANSGNANNIGQSGFQVQNNSGGTINQTYNGFGFHYVASAEL